MSEILGATTIKDFERLLDEIGIWVVYTRSDHRFRCRKCWNYFTNDAELDCDSCFGTGYKVSLERWKVFYSNRFSRGATIDIPLSRAGFTPEHMTYIFSRTDMQTTLEDKIFIVEWDTHNENMDTFAGRPKQLVQVFRVLYTEPFFIGQQIYLLTHCGIMQETIKIFEPTLLRTDIPTTLPDDFRNFNLTSKP